MTTTVTNQDEVDSLAERLATESQGYAGHLTEREGAFLAVLAAHGPGEGVVLEIGSFKGRSTIILARVEQETKGRSNVVAVDPLTSPSVTDPSLDGAASCRDVFFGNLERAGVRESIEFHECTAHKLSLDWVRSIRLLWIDGDHTYDGVTSDFVDFSPHLAPGGIIAFHDVMHCAGVTRVFAERVLRSGSFGVAGVVGSIGWAQLRVRGSVDAHARDRFRLADRLEHHAAVVESGDSRRKKAFAKLLRWRVPHDAMTAQEFVSKIDPGIPVQFAGGVASGSRTRS